MSETGASHQSAGVLGPDKGTDPRLPNGQLLAVAGLVVGLIAVCVYLVVDRSSDSAGGASNHTPQVPASAAFDRADPVTSGCIKTRSDVPGSAIAVESPLGVHVALVDLQRSIPCGSVWIEAFALKRPILNLHVEMIRTGQLRVSFLIKRLAAGHYFGIMLEDTSGCVYADVWVSEGGLRKSAARTICVQQSESKASSLPGPPRCPVAPSAYSPAALNGSILWSTGPAWQPARSLL